MDFNDTPEEAAFRAEAKAWLEANAELRRTSDDVAGTDVLGERVDDRDHIKREAQELAEEEGGRRLGLHHLAQGVRRARRHRRSRA